MIALLRALQLDPKILLVDEPTSAMDHGTAKGLESVVNQWINEKETSRAVVWVSHDRGQLQRVANQEWEVKDAKLISINGGGDGIS